MEFWHPNVPPNQEYRGSDVQYPGLDPRGIHTSTGRQREVEDEGGEENGGHLLHEKQCLELEKRLE